VDLSFDSAIPLRDIYPKEMKSPCQRDTCTPRFIATLFTLAKMWNQQNCPPTDGWIKKRCNRYRQWNIFQSQKRMKVLLFATEWMELKDTVLKKIS
jgi:hypothetical protein